jgi:hypothetical protein
VGIRIVSSCRAVDKPVVQFVDKEPDNRPHGPLLSVRMSMGSNGEFFRVAPYAAEEPSIGMFEWEKPYK